MNEGEICIANIDRRGQMARATGGWVGLVVTAVLITLAFVLDAPRVTRIAVFVPAFLGASGVLQAREKT